MDGHMFSVNFDLMTVMKLIITTQISKCDISQLFSTSKKGVTMNLNLVMCVGIIFPVNIHTFILSAILGCI